MIFHVAGHEFDEIEQSHLLSIKDSLDNKEFIYAEQDADGNLATDKYFICGPDYLTKLHFGFERQYFLSYSVFDLTKKLSSNFDSLNTQFDLRRKLKSAQVVVEKSFFHDSPDENTKRKGFVVKGDVVIIDNILENWIRIAYEGKRTTTIGWVSRKDLRIQN